MFVFLWKHVFTGDKPPYVNTELYVNFAALQKVSILLFGRKTVNMSGVIAARLYRFKQNRI